MGKDKFNNKIDEIRRWMGYSDKPLHKYGEFADDLMDYEGLSKYAKKFNLRKSDILAILKVITESSAYQRTSQKSMMATRSNTIIPPENTEELKQIFNDSEALVQTRQTHMREVADIAKIISNGLGLNSDFAYGIGLSHDISHTPNGHGGERYLTKIGMLRNCGYIVHNAMGANVFEREDIIGRAIKEVKQFNSKAKTEDIKEFLNYVIDGVVSHNGEGTVGRIIPEEKDYEKMLEEIRKCFTVKGYDKGIMPATMEGAVIRYADIIAYTRSDILDGFRLKDVSGNKILDKFDDEYLSIIGTVLARRNNFEKLLALENKFLLEMYGLSKRIEELSSLESKTPEDRLELARTKKERSLIESKYREFEAGKIEYAKDYIKGIKQKSEVKTEVTQMMQNAFIMDLIETSKGKKEITMSPLMRKTLFSLRELNARRIVPYTRRGFETQELPIAVNELVDIFSNVLIETGIAYKVIPKEIQTELEPSKPIEEYDRRLQEIDLKGTTYDRKICHYYTKQQPKNLRFMYENALESMKDITMHDIAVALGEEKNDGPLKEIYETNKIIPIKRKIGEMRKTSETITPEDRQKLFEQILAEREKEIEKAVASKMAIEYIAGMTDNTLIAVLIDKNLISRQELIEGYGRAEPGKEVADQGVKKLQAVFAKNEGMIYPDDKEDDEISL